MVLQKRLDYGFNGYQVPPVPRATRSARKRGTFKRRTGENQMCAFDLLAIVAGNLLLEKESNPSSSDASTDKDQCGAVNNTVKKELHDEEKPLKLEAHDKESPTRSFSVSGILSPLTEQNCVPNESLCSQNDLNLGLSTTVTSDFAERFSSEKLVNSKSKIGTGTSASKIGGSSSRLWEDDCNVEGKTKGVIKEEPHNSEKLPTGTVDNVYSSGDPVAWDGKPPALVSSDSSVKVASCGEPIPQSSYPVKRDYVNIVSRDDDENSSGCTHPSSTKKFFRPAQRIGNRRIRKILASKYWKVAPGLKDGKLSNNDGNLKSVYRKRKNYYKHQISDRIYPFKKRKHFSCTSPSNSDGGICNEFFLDSPQKGKNGDACGSSPKMHGATEASSSVTGQHTSFQPRDSHVKLRIKSLWVPELFIEIPETATVGSLKRTVLEAVTAILGGGLRVGVLLQGKKIKDDNKTLLQTGISHNNQVDALGFSVEPNPSQAPPSLCPKDSPFLLSCNQPQPLSSYPAIPDVVQQGTLGNLIESDHDSAPSPAGMSIDKSTTDSKALVAVPAINVEALTVVQPHKKSKRSEIVQRRIRRPFSVAEVEALVQAVEKLGTGRWRDVKLRAFDNAKHRTYVDLKDKWKTLVHTARISPQQRRGEPVPQELLDRVLTAHAYWSQLQAKQQLKQQPLETSPLL